MTTSLHTAEEVPPTDLDCPKLAIVSLPCCSLVSSIGWSLSWLALIVVLSGNLGAYEHSVMAATKAI